MYAKNRDERVRSLSWRDTDDLQYDVIRFKIDEIFLRQKVWSTLEKKKSLYKEELLGKISGREEFRIYDKLHVRHSIEMKEYYEKVEVEDVERMSIVRDIQRKIPDFYRVK